MRQDAQIDETSLPPSGSREVAASFNGPMQTRSTIGAAPRRPVVARELAHHQRILRPHRPFVSRGGDQSFPNRSSPRTAREGDESGFRISFVFGRNRQAVLRNTKKACDPLPVGQEPRFHAPDRNPETHSGSGVAKVPLTPGGRTFLPVEIAKRRENGGQPD